MSRHNQIILTEYVQGHIAGLSVEQAIQFLSDYTGKNAKLQGVWEDYEEFNLKIVVDETKEQYEARKAAEKVLREKAKRDKGYQRYLRLKAQFEPENDYDESR